MLYISDKDVENVINARDRNCRIGKVTEKSQKPWSLQDALAEYQRPIRMQLMQNDMFCWPIGNAHQCLA